MPHTQVQHYVITARTQQGLVQQTRKMAASAVVLAMKFREAGYFVEVTDPMGNVISPERIKGTLLSEVRGRTGDRYPSI